MSGRRRWLTATLAVLAAAVIVVVAVVVVQHLRKPSALPHAQAAAFAAAWSRGDTAAMARAADHLSADSATTAVSLVRAAPGSRAEYRVANLVHQGKHAVATYHARVDVAGFGPVEWQGRFGLVKVGTRWLVRWTPSVAYPGLQRGQRLTLHRTWRARAPILDAGGAVLEGEQPAVILGLEPDRITDLAQVKQVLTSTAGVDPKHVDDVLHAPGVQPFYFLPVVTVTADKFAAIKPQLDLVKGIHYQRTQVVMQTGGGPPSQLLGSVGEITAEALTKLGPPYQAGDQVGLSGLEQVYEPRLAGRPNGDVEVVDTNGKVVSVVKHFAGTAPQSVQITIDARTQAAANTAMAGTDHAALVAIDTSTGAIRAVVSTPTTDQFDRALNGRYPPGSTFKVVTATALVAAGRTAATQASCPPNITVDGRTFQNFEGEAPGAISFHDAFVISCNTAFIGLAQQLPPEALLQAAGLFGFNQTLHLPVDAAGGSFPPTADGADASAAAIGQGRVLASPLQMASVAAAVASGQWRAPALTIQPAPVDPATAAALPANVASTLRSFMRDVVAEPSGTGHAADIAGAPVSGKTGTAEFGSGNPPPTHAWFIGFRGNLAFAVIVENGGVGGRVAAPLAARFLRALGS